MRYSQWNVDVRDLLGEAEQKGSERAKPQMKNEFSVNPTEITAEW